MYVLLVGVAIGVLMSFQPNVIAAIQSCGLQLMHGLLYVYYASALLYDFHHLLMLTEVSSLPSIMFWKVQEVLTAIEYCDGDLVEHLQL